MKAYTNIDQSKKLAEILPLESADLYYDRYSTPVFIDKNITHESIKNDKYEHLIPCWSLATLLGLMPFQIIENNQRYGFYQWKGFNSQGETYCFEYKSNIGERLYETIHWNNPIDAAFEMICWLKENEKI